MGNAKASPELMKTLKAILDREPDSAVVAVSPPAAPETRPAAYRCGTCGAEGVRLYRRSHTYSDGLSLACNGCLPGDAAWWVPARPVGDTFWGHTSGPHKSVRDWFALPEKDASRPGAINAGSPPTMENMAELIDYLEAKVARLEALPVSGAG